MANNSVRQSAYLHIFSYYSLKPGSAEIIKNLLKAVGDNLCKQAESMEDVLNLFDWNKQYHKPYDYWAALWHNATSESKPPPQIKTPIIYKERPKQETFSDFKNALQQVYADRKVSLENPKKIIGYKAPYDLYNGLVKKGTIFCKMSPKGYVMYPENRFINGKSVNGVAREIVTRWEPVYGEASTVLNIGSPRVQVTITKGKIEAEGRTVHHADIKRLTEVMQPSNLINNPWIVEFETVKIGCSRFSYTEILQVYNEYINLNK